MTIFNIIKKILYGKPLTEQERIAMARREKLRRMGEFWQTSPRKEKSRYIDLSSALCKRRK